MFVTFGCGYVLINPIAGNRATNPTAEQMLGVQDISLDIDQKLVELKGANKGPDDVATAEMTVKGKVSMGRIDFALFNQAYFADTTATGQAIAQVSEPGTIPGTPFSITVTNSATFTTDLGVRFAATVQPLQRVASAPATGQYSVSAGVYTFAAADTTKAVLISYAYTAVAGRTYTVHNQLMGYGPIVEMYLWEPYASILNVSNNNGWHIYAARFGKLSMPMKRADFTYPSMDFESFPNAAGAWFDTFDSAGF